MRTNIVKRMVAAAAVAGLALSSAAEPILLQAKTIRPEEESARPRLLSASPAAMPPMAVYLVQHDGQIPVGWRKKIANAGGKIYGYIPNNAYLVGIASTNYAAFASGVEHSYLGEFAPEFKYDAAVVQKKLADDAVFSISLFEASERAAVAEAIRGIAGCEVISEGGESIRAMLTEAGVKAITRLWAVYWIEPYVAPKPCNNVAVNENLMNVRAVWPGGDSGLGLTGRGQIVGVADTGLDTGNYDTIHEDVRGRVVAFGLSHKDKDGNLDGDWSDTDENRHGTHVVGSVLGNGTMSYGDIKGVAYEANLVFQALSDGKNPVVPPSDLGSMFQQAYDNGARIHSDSWGSGIRAYDNLEYTANAGYTTKTLAIDSYMFEHPDMLILFAAGNCAMDMNKPYGVVDEGMSLSPEATSKNALVVGASETVRVEGGYATRAKYSSDDYEPPIYDDYCTQPWDGVHQGMAASSSRGPSRDGRIKPDIVAPGTGILSLSALSQDIPVSDLHYYNRYYRYMEGTSMATPLVAGSATLVRQWLVEHRGIANPDAATIKALLLAGAKSLAPGQYGTGEFREIPDSYPNNVEGWGQVNVRNTVNSGNGIFICDGAVIAQGEQRSFSIHASAGHPLSIIMAYTDAPAVSMSLYTANHLSNDLDMKVRSPSGQIYFPNSRNDPDPLNNVEGVRLAANEVEDGDYVVTVYARSVVMPMRSDLTGRDDATRFSLVANGCQNETLSRSHDDFEYAVNIINKDSYTTTFYDKWWRMTSWNTNATLQANEPLPQYEPNASNTLWWRWTAQEDCKVTFRTLGSKHIEGDPLDTVMGIYTYSDGAFTIVGEDDDVDNDDPTSSVTFVATAGETYYICVGGCGSSETGEIQLNWIFRPVNDDMEYAIPISGPEGNVTGVNSNASVVASEPLRHTNEVYHTLWWKWTAPGNGRVDLYTPDCTDGLGNFFDTLMGVYTRSAGGTISTVGENGSYGVSFDATAGETYYVCVGTTSISRLGTFKLRWYFSTPNRYRETAISISGGSGTVSGLAFDTEYVWWKWTAQETCRVTFDTIGSEVADSGAVMDTSLSIYVRSDGQNSIIGENDNIDGNDNEASRVTFTATEGETYYIRVGVYRYYGLIQLNWNASPPNDYWDTAPEISGRSGTVSCENANMTAEEDEPLDAYLDQQGVAADKTLWWKWTAPETGEAVFDTIGSFYDDLIDENYLDTALGVYTCSDGTFSPVAENNDLDYGDLDRDIVRSRVNFTVTAGTTYYICVAAIDYSSFNPSLMVGEIRLNWNIVKGISESSGSASAATAQESNPMLEYMPTAGNSAWWTWTAPSNGKVAFDTVGSQLDGGGAMDTFLSIYTNCEAYASSEGGLQKVWENDNINLRTTGSITFMAEAGVKYYVCAGDREGAENGTIRINWGAPSPNGESVDLASVISFDTTIADGTTIYGTLGGTTLHGRRSNVSIAPGATVTISNVTINGEDNADCQWAGLTCEGDATLVLEGVNVVMGFYNTCPGIYVPSGSRLDIYGSGSLTASSNGHGAGIGGGSYVPCMECGDIYIHGGTITATGGEGAAGIGSGNGGSCGDIVIAGGVVTATGGEGAAAIGAGGNALCGAVTVAPELTDVTIGATRMIAPSWDGNLSTLSARTAIATNGTVVTGTLGINGKVCVAPGATVTLRDATIGGVDSAECPWAGITCLGSATIVLEGANAVRGFHHDYPGIYVPEGGTLVVRGPGALEARSNTFGAAGIGGGWEIPCGNIVIEGGTITAEGGWGGGFCFGGAGIGGGYKSSCGYITISGGNVTATGGGEAAGIGGGYSNIGCGAVTIGSHVTRVYASRGVSVVDRDPFAATIGAGSLGAAVSVTLGPGLFDVLDGDEHRTIWPWNGDLSVLDARNCDITAADGTTIHGSFSGNHRVYIAAGATVTLSNAVINGTNNSSCPWAGITCLGDATIVLEGENAVRGFYEDNPGIQVPAGSTLAITGSGSLTASSNGNSGGIGGSVAVDDGLSDTASGTTRTLRWNGDLSKLRGNAVAADGMTICGRLGPTSSNKVSIAAGATVTLRDATIEGMNSVDCPWPGLTCEGDATIVLEGANVVRGFHEDYPGIFVPGNRTLTIRGTGSLAASSNGKAAGIGGGNGNGLHSGDIAIEGGMIVATGGDNSAGIGGGNGTACWRVTISGGDVTAMGGANAAGVGAGGGGGSCHEVVVGPYITRVVATCGEGCSPVNGIKAEEVTVHPSLGDVTEGRTRTISIPVWNGNLTGLVRDVTAVNGTVMTGTNRSEYYKVSIAPGATVTLSNATIDVSARNFEDCSWAGVNCLGDATIVLEGTNFVRGFYKDYPGIHVPAGSRLVIRGSGSLEVYGDRGAGIGGGYEIPCGDIVIEGGDIEAHGGEGAAAIGGGYNSSCGAITIGPGITRVVTARYGLCWNTIGAGNGGTCGAITLDGLRDDHGTNTRTLLPPWDGNLTDLSGEVAARDGMVIYGTNYYDGKVTISVGATVTLSNAVSKGISFDPAKSWAGFTCEGNATIVLVGENVAWRFGLCNFGIVVPAGSTLSVQGVGSLEAFGNSAGIGGGGNVVVASGLADTGDDDTTRLIRWDGNLSMLTGDVTAMDGTVIHGTLNGDHKVFVAPGATVTISNATIAGASSATQPHAGITCLGAATLIIQGSNYVRPYGKGPAAIYFTGDHEEILDGGTLDVGGEVPRGTSKRGARLLGTEGVVYGGAGIGAGHNESCGNILIRGNGTIIATGGDGAAGIGGAVGGDCGTVTILGGVVVANGGSGAAGIGSGEEDSGCAGVTISGGSVTATGGGDGASAIGAGAGSSSTCGNVVMEGMFDTSSGETWTVWDGNLAALRDDVTVADGMTLYGTLQDYCKVSIVPGATVTLSNAVVDLPLPEDHQGYQWAGISCKGDARIVLADASTNTVKGFHIYYPGIHVPTNCTLTIAGSGVLDARSNGRGAGIGGGWNISCGNIVIESGIVNAVGGTYCAGIGGGHTNLIAVTCGNITINSGIAKVVATRGPSTEDHESAAVPIGVGDGSTCGTVTINPDLIDDHGATVRSIVSGGMGYETWATKSRINASWYDSDAYDIAYVFRWAFSKPPMVGNFALLDIEFNAEDKAVVKTPPLKNKVGFRFEVVASDSVDGTGNVSRYELDPSGETVINETGKTTRFFRLRATPR